MFTIGSDDPLFPCFHVTLCFEYSRTRTSINSINKFIHLWPLLKRLWLLLFKHLCSVYFEKKVKKYFVNWIVSSSVQFSCSVLSDSSWPHESQHTRPPCPSPAPGVHSDSRPSSQWCHPAVSSSAIPFSNCSQSLPVSEYFPMSQLFAWGGQSIGVSALASFLPMNTQGWSPSEWTGWTSLQSKGLSKVFSNTTVQKHQFFSTQLSSQSNSHIHTWPLEKPYPWLDGPLLAK